MRRFTSHFKFSKQERSGIFFLLLIIVILQAIFYVVKYTSYPVKENLSVDKETQSIIDSLKKRSLHQDTIQVFPFNPNFISDYKGYTLGMSPEEIDRLHSYRKRNLFVNTTTEFQEVTQISDSLLNRISPYFKFPEWTKNRFQKKPKYQVAKIVDEPDVNPNSVQPKDLNIVTADELKSIYGIGDKLSQRIIKFRDRLGGFFSNDQLYDVYGLEPKVVQRTLKRYKVLSQPDIEKININTASEAEISKLIYLSKTMATKIVEYRKDNGAFNSFDELTKIEGFPSQKIDRIKLYLTF